MVAVCSARDMIAWRHYGLLTRPCAHGGTLESLNMSTHRRALTYCRSLGDLKAMCTWSTRERSMLYNVDVCLSYIYSRFLCEILSGASSGIVTTVWLLGMEGYPHETHLEHRARLICLEAGRSVAFRRSTADGIQGFLRRGERHVMLLHRFPSETSLSGDTRELHRLRIVADTSGADCSILTPVTRGELLDVETYEGALRGADIMLGIATGLQSTLFGAVVHTSFDVVTASHAHLHGLLNWYDVRVRTMRDHRERCWDCRLFRLYCCDQPCTSTSIRMELSRLD